MNNRKHKFFNVKHHHQPLEKKCFHKYLKCECFRMNKNIFLKNFFWKELLAKQILSHIHSFEGSMLDEMTWRNSSKYVIFHICKNTKVVLSIYYFVLWLLFSLLNILVYDQEKNSTKWKKQLCVFIYIYNMANYKYYKFCWVNYIKHKPLIFLKSVYHDFFFWFYSYISWKRRESGGLWFIKGDVKHEITRHLSYV